MSEFMVLILSILIVAGAYLLGSIPWGLLIGKMYGIDVRTVGSKNIGATNVTRTVGKWAGKICFLLDFLKGCLPVLAIQCVPGVRSWAVIAVMFAAILGHVFPIFLRFKGGKGISTAAGAIMALAPGPLFVALAVWVVVFFISRYVSLASITAAAVLPVIAWCFRWADVGNDVAKNPVTLWFLTAVAVLAVIRHHANIRRLLNGTESRFGRPAKNGETESK